MCGDLKKDTLECTENVLEIHKAYIGQDVQELFKCVGFDVSYFQNPCTGYPDLTKKTKLRCDGRQSCNVSDSLIVNVCKTHFRSFNVEFSCQVNRTKGNFTIINLPSILVSCISIPLHLFISLSKDVAQKQSWCPNGYSLSESSCYKISDRKLPWRDAKTFCEIETSHLITINDKKEDVLLSLMVASSDIHGVWIGLNDLAYEDFYEWSDGSEVSCCRLVDGFTF